MIDFEEINRNWTSKTYRYMYVKPTMKEKKLWVATKGELIKETEKLKRIVARLKKENKSQKETFKIFCENKTEEIEKILKEIEN